MSCSDSLVRFSEGKNLSREYMNLKPKITLVLLLCILISRVDMIFRYDLQTPIDVGGMNARLESSKK